MRGNIAAVKIFVNGSQIGSSETGGNHKYQIPDNILKEGENSLVIRLDDKRENGGLLDSYVRVSNSIGENPANWYLPYKGSMGIDYWYNPDSIRQY